MHKLICRIFPLLFTLSLSLLTGCATTKEVKPTHTACFYLESDPNLPPKWSQPGILPISGLRYNIYPQPVINEQDITQVDITKVDLGQCLSFQLTPSGTQKLYQLSIEHPGESLFLFVNNKPIGFRGIDTPIANGHIMIFVEQPEKELPELLDQIRLATATPLAKK